MTLPEGLHAPEYSGRQHSKFYRDEHGNSVGRYLATIEDGEYQVLDAVIVATPLVRKL